MSASDMLHPPEGRTLGVDALRAERQGVAPALGRLARCPLCLGALVFARASSRGTCRIKHEFNEDEQRCLLTTSSYQPEGLAVHRRRDVNVECVQRAAFIEHWARHYGAMKQAAPALTIQRFTHVIEYADVLNLWSYPRLAHKDVPYVLLVLAEFMIQRLPAGRANWVRFCFDGSVHELADLWSPEGGRAQLYRIVYREPFLTPFPSAKEMLRWEPVQRNECFLEKPAPRLTRMQLQAFRRWMKARIGPDRIEPQESDLKHSWRVQESTRVG